MRKVRACGSKYSNHLNASSSENRCLTTLTDSVDVRTGGQEHLSGMGVTPSSHEMERYVTKRISLIDVNHRPLWKEARAITS